MTTNASEQPPAAAPLALSKPALSKVEGSKGRGGRRPGAGAPKGNTNAFKTGRYSRQLRLLVRALRRDLLAIYAFLLEAKKEEQSNISSNIREQVLAKTRPAKSQSNNQTTSDP